MHQFGSTTLLAEGLSPSSSPAEKKSVSAPHVVVLARADHPHVAGQLAEQTYYATELFFVPPDETPDQLAQRLREARADYVLFWPEEGTPKSAAVEKLVLALHLAPDQDGVADAERGSTGFWLARPGVKMDELITRWHRSPTEWITACRQLQPQLFYIAENLLEDDAGRRRLYSIEHLFGKLPMRFANYQPIETDPLWSLPADEPDDRSVLFLVHNLPMGGACKFLLDVAGQLVAQGWRVTVATTMHNVDNPNPWLDELLRIVPGVFLLSHSRPVDLPRQIVHLARTRRCGRVVISHSMLAYQLLAWLRHELPGVAFTDYTHIEYETEWPLGGYARQSVDHRSLLDLSLVSSAHLRDWMVAHGAEAEAIRVCHTNIDTAKWAPSAETRARDRAELGIDDSTALILYPCRIAEQKRPELLCNIVAALDRATHASFVVAVAGDGPLLSALCQFVENRGLHDRFRILGAVPLERVVRLHNAADIFLLPSLIEGIALALFEAMALESVPVVSDVGGQRELVTRECGHLIPLGSPETEIPAYVAALRRLVEKPEERARMARACRQRVHNHFPLTHMSATFIAALNDAGLRRTQCATDPALAREMATMAIEQIRLTHEGLLRCQMNALLEEKCAKQEKVIAKLQRQTAARRIPEEHALHG